MLDFLDYIDLKDASQLRDELKELYSSYELVRNHFKIKMLGNEVVDKSLLRKYKAEISDALFPNDLTEGGLDVDKVDRILKQLNSESAILYYIECCLYSIEECTDGANMYGGDFGEEFYIYFEELFKHVIQLIIHRGLKSKYGGRLRRIADSAFDGYGHYDQLQDILSGYIPV